MNKKFLLALGCAVLFGLLSLFLGRRYLEQHITDQKTKEQVDVVVAIADIPYGTEIKDSQVALMKRMRSELPDGFISNKKDVIGRVANEDIITRSPVIARKLAPLNSRVTISNGIKDGYRLISVPVNESSSVAGFISPGNYVDVIAVSQPSGGGKLNAKVILQNINVFATGDRFRLNESGNTQSKSAVPSSVTFQVTPEQAEKLALAMKMGSLQLALRNPADQEIVSTPSSHAVIGSPMGEAGTSNSLAGSASRGTANNNLSASAGAYPPIPISTPTPAASPEKKATPATPPAPTTFDVELIRGTSKEVRQFPINATTASANAGATQQ